MNTVHTPTTLLHDALGQAYERGYTDGVAESEKQMSKALDDVVQRLRELSVTMTASIAQRTPPKGIKAEPTIDALMNQVQEMAEALRFYADVNSYLTPRIGNTSGYPMRVLSDGGERARVVLARYTGKGASQ